MRSNIFIRAGARSYPKNKNTPAETGMRKP